MFPKTVVDVCVQATGEEKHFLERTKTFGRDNIEQDDDRLVQEDTV